MVLVAVITLWAAGQNSFQAVGELASGQVRLAQLLVAVTAATMFVLAATADKRREQERARDAEQRYRAIFEQAGVGVAVLSADGEYLAANERYLEIAGYGRDELLGSHYTAILDDTEASASRNVLAQLSGGTPPIISRDLNIRTKGGEKRWIRATSSKIVGAAGAVDQVVTVVEDISERVKAEVALSESEKRFRLAQQYAGVGVFDINLTEESALHSPESAALFGVPWHPGAYRLSEFVDRIGQSQLHEMRAKLFRSAVDEAPFEMSLRVSMPDRRIRWIRLHGRYDPYEERPRLLGLVIDITSDVEAKAQLREANEKFLRVTRLSAMGAMASTLAHELNQPLSAITNYVEAGRYKLCDAEAVDGKLLAILDSARDQALRAGEIIRKMRAFAVSGEVVFERVSLGPVLAAACAGVQQLKMADDVTLICHPVRPDLLVVGDPVQLEQVMSNLVRNAVEATEGGGASGNRGVHRYPSARRIDHSVRQRVRSSPGDARKPVCTVSDEQIERCRPGTGPTDLPNYRRGAWRQIVGGKQSAGWRDLQPCPALGRGLGASRERRDRVRAIRATRRPGRLEPQIAEGPSCFRVNVALL